MKLEKLKFYSLNKDMQSSLQGGLKEAPPWSYSGYTETTCCSDGSEAEDWHKTDMCWDI